VLTRRRISSSVARAREERPFPLLGLADETLAFNHAFNHAATRKDAE